MYKSVYLVCHLTKLSLDCGTVRVWLAAEAFQYELIMLSEGR